MWNSSTRCALILLALSSLAGCFGGSGNPPQMAPTDVPPWPELQMLGSPEIMKPIYAAKDKKNASALKNALSSPEFSAAVDKFADSKIPSGYATPERKKAQEEAVAKFRKVIELAKSSSSFKDLIETYDDASKSYIEAGAPRNKK